MVSYAEYPSTMPHDFELYSNQEAQFDILTSNQPYLPTSTYLDPAFSAPFDAVSLQTFSDVPRSQADLRFHFDGIAQGVKPSYQHYSPAASPNSGSHSFDIQPPNLSTSSESGASVSSSAMGSPSLNPQYHDAWSSMSGLGLAPGIVQGSSGFDYDGMVATDKLPGCVGESFEISSSASVSSSIAFPCASSVLSSSSSVGSHREDRACLETPPSRPCSFGQSNPSRSETSSQNSVFRSPTTPASAKFSSPLSMRRSPSGPGIYKRRRNSLLSNEIWPNDIPDSNTDSSLSPVNRRSHFSQNSSGFIPPLESSCRFPSSLRISLSRSTFPSSASVSKILKDLLLTSSSADPTLIQPFPTPIPFTNSPYSDIRTTPSPHFPFVEQPPSPAPSNASAHSQNRAGSRQFKRRSQSPYLHTQAFQPYPNFSGSRRQSSASIHSHQSQASRKSGSSYELDDESRDKGLCPIPECGRVFKDLKAHMLTHQNERPEKCPIATCEYHLKGFARKYDKNRHTLTHYKGTMVCGFCPGSGSAAEKSFNRADVFKRHLTSVHGVEQAPPNSRKKSPTGKKAYTASQSNLAGTCSTCSVTFANAQEFYEHLDDCVLRVVQQADPSEAINQKLLSSMADDKDVKETMDRNGLPNSVDYSVPVYDEDEEEEEEDIDVDDQNDDTYGVRSSRSGKGTLKSRKNTQA